MYTQNSSGIITIAVSFFFISVHSNLYSQEIQSKLQSKINVTMIASEDGFTDLEMLVINKFKNALEEKGLFSETDNDFELLLNVKKVDENNKIVLSIVEMQVLPKEAVDVGKKAEIFYSMIDDNKKANLPAEGKFIREYLSSEYMKQLRTIWSDNLDIINISELDSYCKKIIAKYL